MLQEQAPVLITDYQLIKSNSRQSIIAGAVKGMHGSSGMPALALVTCPLLFAGCRFLAIPPHTPPSTVSVTLKKKAHTSLPTHELL